MSLNTGNAILSNGITLDSSYNVGIGGAASGSYKLQVTGTTNLTGALSGTTGTFGSSLIVGSTSILYGNVAIKSNSATSYFGLNVIANGNNNFIAVNHTGTAGIIETEFSTGGSHTPLQFVTGGSTRLTIASSGNVGIGTTAPGVKFVNSGAAVSDTPTLGSATIGASALLSANGLYGLYSGVSINGHVWHQVQRNDGNSSVYSLAFQPSGGNVGIGTISPDWMFKIEKNTSSGSYGQYPTAVVSNPNAAGYSAFYLFSSTTNLGGIEFSNAENLMRIQSAGASLFVNGGSERMRITSGGNVLIGTTTDSGLKFQVNGEVYSKGDGAILNVQARDLSLYYGFFGSTSSSLNFWSSTYGVAGTFSPTTGVYTPTSDINKKKDFEASTIGLNAILGLKPTLYRMKLDDANSPKQLGFIAQEVKEFIPQAYVESDDMIGLSDRPIIAALVKAVQELKAEIDELKNK